ncbi:uncharacterized protein LOC131532373 isoform X2 [Onychostoma macrolepis]|uniref:uncharacterized protein LOC131532373 isoform X2 n=1 Tax=Onychostoma macrolepis TaxID=369639 RepID=UPI00272B286C|nr:uncharacterized protein LOC131532373 isoform X2 [Onychostoma macrolepis]
MLPVVQWIVEWICAKKKGCGQRFHWCFVIVGRFQIQPSQFFQCTKHWLVTRPLHCKYILCVSSRLGVYCFHCIPATQIQSVSRSDGGSAPRDDLDSPECQRRPGHLDEPQRQIPSEDLVGTRPQEPDKSSAQSDLCCSLELNHTMLVSSVQRRTAPKLCLVAPKVLSPMKFWVLAAVAFGLLIWGRLADCKDIIGRELNWMMSTLNHQ